GGGQAGERERIPIRVGREGVHHLETLIDHRLADRRFEGQREVSLSACDSGQFTAERDVDHRHVLQALLVDQVLHEGPAGVRSRWWSGWRTRTDTNPGWPGRSTPPRDPDRPPPG